MMSRLYSKKTTTELLLLIIFIEGSYLGGVYLFIKMDLVKQYKQSVTSLSTYPPNIVPECYQTQTGSPVRCASD